MKQTVLKTAAKTSRTAESEPLKLLKRIGLTTFTVTIRFNENSAETIEDKILKLVESGVSKIA
jgi:hypothetical protein